MLIDKIELREKLHEIVGNSIMIGEEADVTANKVIKEVMPIIDFLSDQVESLKDPEGTIALWIQEQAQYWDQRKIEYMKQTYKSNDKQDWSGGLPG